MAERLVKQVWRVQCRQTGCWLSVERDRDMWVSFCDIRWATAFDSPEEAKQTARTFGLTYERFRVTSSTAMPV